jgi:type IV pilus assembly protein PilA
MNSRFLITVFYLSSGDFKFMKRKNEKGFTLIELLVVVAIIGILAAIAIPQFSAYRARGFDSRAKSDLRNLATAEEAYFADHEVYKTCADASACESALPGASASEGVVISMTASTSSFTGSSSHPKGSGTTFTWNSAAGGLQ